MTTTLTALTEAEAKVVDVVRDLHDPVVDYVQKGVDLAGRWLPPVTYPDNLPQPGEVIDSQYKFLTDLLAAQYDLVKAVAATVAPLVGTTVSPAKPAKPARAAKATKAA
ncbi:MAG TPA: hypothetical protein VFZ77_11480 [Acidimicrobiales bacterium]